jgi:hypothetical protein
MAQTGFTPIQLYSTSTAAAAPVAGNLTNSTLGSELAINITDGKLFYKDNANAVQVIAWKTTPTTAGGTGLTTYTAGDLSYYATGTTFTKLAIGASTTILTSTGSAPQWSATSGITVGTATNLAGGLAGSVPYQTGAGATTFVGIGATGNFLSSTGSAPQWSAPAALTEVDDTNVTMTLGGTPSTALLSSVSMTLGWTGTLAVSRGGTALSSFTANGVVYASSTSALATGSALTFDGTNFATTGAATAARFIPSGSTVPTNGMYLPSSNILGFATNSGFRMQLGTSGLSVNTTTSNAQITVASSYTSTGIPNAGNSTIWLINDGGSVLANNGPGITFNARSRGSPNEIQPMAGLKGAKLNTNDDEIAGYLAFYTSNNTARTLVEQMRLWNTGGLSLGNTTDPGAGNLSVTGFIRSNSPVLSGYATGAGGTVTQGAGSGKATTVTLDKPTGKIVMNNATLNAGTAVTFQVNNSLVSNTDTVLISSDTTVNYDYVFTAYVGTGNFVIRVKNDSAANRSEAVPILFTIIKGVAS